MIECVIDEQAHDGVAYGRNTTITINVTPVNHAPSASNITSITSSLIPGLVQLNGTDVDRGDTLPIATITSLPVNGSLFVTTDGVTKGTQITTVPFNVSRLL
mgnify:CR=1 FL=1